MIISSMIATSRSTSVATPPSSGTRGVGTAFVQTARARSSTNITLTFVDPISTPQVSALMAMTCFPDGLPMRPEAQSCQIPPLAPQTFQLSSNTNASWTQLLGPTLILVHILAGNQFGRNQYRILLGLLAVHDSVTNFDGFFRHGIRILGRSGLEEAALAFEGGG